MCAPDEAAWTAVSECSNNCDKLIFGFIKFLKERVTIELGTAVAILVFGAIELETMEGRRAREDLKKE
jgi:hypothetical protein